ncbi:MAG: baseplate J/gp47 family protein [Acidithiobacillus sp.]|nr:baseplate J/gp47 family protein [Acidithiobacillus sp.]
MPTLSFSEFVSNLIALWAANTGTQPQLDPGDPLLAIFQSFSSQAVFLENIAVQLAALTRAQTSTGANLDTWMAQFNFTRLPAVAATGPVVLSVNSPHASDVNIPLTTIIQTVGGAIQYQLVADNTQPAYVSGTQTYVLPAGATSITATAQATVAGSAYNVQANQLIQFAVQPPGIDNVTNPNAILNGVNAETDNAFRARFILYLQGLRQATLPAVEAAVESVQSDLQYVIVPNQQLNGQTQYGYFYVTIWPYTSELQAAVYAAVSQVIALGVQFNVYSSEEITVNISVTIETAAGYTPSVVASAVQTALEDYVAGLQLGETLYWSYLYDVIYGVPGVLNALNLLLNGGTSDVVATAQQIIQPDVITVNTSLSTL